MASKRRSAPKSAKKPKPKPKQKSSTRNKTAQKAGGRPTWSRLTAADIMQTEVVTVAATMPLAEVERTLNESRITGAPVTDEAGHIVGVISIRDLIERYTQDPDARPEPPQRPTFYGLDDDDFDGESPEAEWATRSQDTAGDAMTAAVFHVAPTASLQQVARAMVRHAIHRILVAEKGHTVGIISATDLLRAMAR